MPSIIPIFLAVSLGLVLPAAAQPPPAPEPPVIVTSGIGIVRAVPERAFVDLAAEGRAPGPQEAQRRSAEAMTAVQGKLRDAGIEDAAIRTTAFDLQAEYDFPDGRRVLRGYVARNAIEVRVDEIARVGQILDLAVSAGATSVTGVRFDVRDRPALEREALTRAVTEARARAQAMAQGAGQQIDRILRIEDVRAVTSPPVPMLRTAMEAAAPDTPVAPGELEIRAQVSLTVAVR